MQAATRPDRLNPYELFQLKWILGALLTLVAFWTLVELPFSGAPVLLGGAAGVVLAFLARPRWLLRLPRFKPALAFVGTALLLLLDLYYSRPDLISPFVRLVLVLIVLRAVSPRARREDLQLLTLCLFGLMVSGAITLSLTFAVQVVVFAMLGMFLLFLINHTETHEPANLAKRYDAAFWEHVWGHFRWRVFAARLWRSLDWRTLRLAGLLFIFTSAVTAGIFVSIPRVQIGQELPFLGNLRGRGYTGFSDTITFGQVSEIVQDNTVALRADPPNRERVADALYWRMMVLDQYTGEGFRRALNDGQYIQSSAPPLPAVFRTRRPLDDDHRWTIFFEPGLAHAVPLPGGLEEIRFPNRYDVMVSGIAGLVATRYLQTSALSYQLNGVDLRDRWPEPLADRFEDRAPIWANLPAEKDNRLLRRYPQTTRTVPEGPENRRILERVLREITGGAMLAPAEFAARAADWFSTHKAYALSVDLPPGAGDPLLRWLDSPNPGHCEMFAGALTLLARAHGIPARVVSGYLGGDWNSYERYYMVRNRDAHAWVELYDAGQWLRVDPTPGSQREATLRALGGGAAAAADDYNAFLDSLRVLWYRAVVNFDQNEQANLTEQFQAGVKAWLNEVKTWLDAVGKTARELADPTYAPWKPWAWGGLGLLAALALWFALFGRKLLAGFTGLHFRRAAYWEAVRRRAGEYVARFREYPAPEVSPAQPPKQRRRPVNRARWEAVRRRLQELRYGDGGSPPPPGPVFRAADALLRRR